MRTRSVAALWVVALGWGCRARGAAVTPEQAGARLGQDLTPIGAEKAGNQGRDDSGL